MDRSSGLIGGGITPFSKKPYVTLSRHTAPSRNKDLLFPLTKGFSNQPVFPFYSLVSGFFVTRKRNAAVLLLFLFILLFFVLIVGHDSHEFQDSKKAYNLTAKKRSPSFYWYNTSIPKIPDLKVIQKSTL